MGFLKNLIKPSSKSIVKTLYDPAGAVKNAYDESKKPNASAAPDISLDPNEFNGGSYYGDSADPQYGSLLQPFDVEQFYKYEDPGYGFRLQQGNQAVRNAAAAGSGALSGSALKDLLAYSQDMASQEYGNAFNRYQTQQGNIFSRLSSIAQLGQNAAAGVGSQGTSLAGNAGQAYQNAGSAAGAGIVGAGNAIGQGATNYWLYNNPQLWQRPVGTGGV